MKHDEAAPQLIAYAANELSEVASLAVGAHVDGCSECSAWLDAYRGLSRELGGASSLEQPGRHPEADELATLAVEPQRLAETEQTRLRLHLALCEACRRDTELVEAATAAARSGEQGLAETARRWVLANRQAVLAASLLLAGALAVSGSFWLDRSAERAVAARGTAEPRASLEGRQLIHGGRSLVLGATDVRAGAEVTIRAENGVAFDEGFSIGSGASLTVEIVPRDDPSRDL